MYAYRFHIVYLATVLCYARISERILTVNWIGLGYVLIFVNSFCILEEYTCPMVHLWIKVKG